jgi:hypothetical protein
LDQKIGIGMAEDVDNGVADRQNVEMGFRHDR